MRYTCTPQLLLLKPHKKLQQNNISELRAKQLLHVWSSCVQPLLYLMKVL